MPEPKTEWGRELVRGQEQLAAQVGRLVSAQDAFNVKQQTANEALEGQRVEFRSLQDEVGKRGKDLASLRDEIVKQGEDLTAVRSRLGTLTGIAGAGLAVLLGILGAVITTGIGVMRDSDRTAVRVEALTKQVEAISTRLDARPVEPKR